MQAEKKPVYTAIATAALVIIVAFAILDRWNSVQHIINIPGANSSSTASGSADTLPVEVKTIDTKGDIFTVKSEYPRFPSSPALTAQIEKYIQDTTSQFQKNVRDNDQARRNTAAPGENAPSPTYTLTIWWESAQLNTRNVSFIMHAYAYDGGANGRQELRSFNWDMTKQREVTLSDLFPNDPTYLTRISQFTRQALQDTLGSNTSPEFLNDGTQPISTSFQWFTYTDEAFTFYFPKYQVAPGVVGEQKVVMPRDAETFN